MVRPSVRRWMVGLFVLGFFFGCAAQQPLPSTLDQPTRQRIEALRLVRQLATANEAAGNLLLALSGTAASLGTTGTLTVAEERAIQRDIEMVATTLRRRLRDLKDQIEDPARPLPTRKQVIQDLSEDLTQLLQSLAVITNPVTRAELRAIGLALQTLLVGLDLATALEDVRDEADAALSAAVWIDDAEHCARLRGYGIAIKTLRATAQKEGTHGSDTR